MSKKDLILEIDKVLDSFPDKALSELLAFLKSLDNKQTNSMLNKSAISRILSEDKVLLERLAQ